MAWNLYNGISRAVWLSSYWTSLNPSVMGWMMPPSTPNSHDKVLTPGISVWHLFVCFSFFLNTTVFLINRLYFSVLGLWKKWTKNIKSSQILPSPHPQFTLLLTSYTGIVLFFSFNSWWTDTEMFINYSPLFTFEFFFYVACFYVLWQIRMACLHHYSIIYDMIKLNCPKNSLCSTYSFFPLFLLFLSL